MAKTYVLLTGATGGTGSMILDKLLKAGHNVNAVVRSLAKARAGLRDRYPDAVADGTLVLTEIPDMAAPDAFHAAAKTAWAIIHAATPIADADFDDTMVKPTWAHLDNVLRAAAASSGAVRRVVVTGSIASVMRMPEDVASGATLTEADFNGITRAEAAANLGAAYQYSKISSEQRAWEFVEREKPAFGLVYLLAPLIIGKSLQVGFKPDKTGLGGVSMVYRELFDREELGFLFPYYMDVKDVSDIHVKALEEAIPTGQRYLLRAPGLLTAAAAANKIREALPELKGRVPAGDETAKPKGTLSKIDTTNFDRAFGKDWKSWEAAIIDIAKDIVEHE